MGFRGTFIVHRGRSLLAELMPRVQPFHDATLCYDGVCGDWQVTRVFARARELPADFLVALRDATGAPVLAADVLDSDAALVHGVGRSTEWKVWLHLDRAIGFLYPPPAPTPASAPFGEHYTRAVKARILARIPGGASAAGAAISWAHEAGLRPGGVHAVTAALTGEDGPVEARLFALLDRLGLATGEVEPPEPPAPVDVLHRRIGHSLARVDLVAHRPVRGERLRHAGMPDLRLHFNGQPAVTACACGGSFAFLPDRPAEHPGPLGVVAEASGQPLRDAATIRHRFHYLLKGVVLRFGDSDLYLAAVKGAWVAAIGAADFQRRLTELGDGDVHVNPWLTQLP